MEEEVQWIYSLDCAPPIGAVIEFKEKEKDILSYIGTVQDDSNVRPIHATGNKSIREYYWADSPGDVYKEAIVTLTAQRALFKGKVIHCPTQGEAEQLLALANSLGFMWTSGRSFIGRDCWDIYKEDTCYFIDDGTYANVNFYKSEHPESTEYTIISFKEFKETYNIDN